MKEGTSPKWTLSQDPGHIKNTAFLHSHKWIPYEGSTVLRYFFIRLFVCQSVLSKPFSARVQKNVNNSITVCGGLMLMSGLC